MPKKSDAKRTIKKKTKKGDEEVRPVEDVPLYKEDTKAENASWADKMEAEVEHEPLSKNKSVPKKVVEHIEYDDNDHDHSTVPESHVVKHFTYPKGSVANFDRSKIIELSKKPVKELSNTQLLQVLVWRGEAELNPFLTDECAKTLRKLHRELLPSFKKFTPKRFNKFERNSDNTDRPRSKFSNGNNRPYRK